MVDVDGVFWQGPMSNPYILRGRKPHQPFLSGVRREALEIGPMISARA